MSVRRVIEPRKTVSWEEFCGSDFPSYSVAIDGYCAGPPQSSPDGLKLNINHHEECDRIATRSSCAQALHLVKMGLFDSFVGDDGKPKLIEYLNDVDQDVAFATFILEHPKYVDRPLLKAMVQLEDLLDMSAGFYPIKKRWHILKKLIWASEPYAEARASGRLHRMDAAEMGEILDQSHRRIRAALFGRGKESEPDTSFEVIEDFGRWSFIKEIGPYARFGVAKRGIKAFVSLVSNGGKWSRFLIVRRSRFIRWFPLERIRARLNLAEGVADGSVDGWGGADNVIGSPREKGSILRPEEVLAIVKEEIDRGP